MNTTSPRVDESVFEEVTDAISEGVVCFEADGTVVFVNPAARDVLGSEPGALLERPVDDLFPDDQTSTLTRLLQRAMREERVTAAVTMCPTRGREISVTLTVQYAEQDDLDLFVANFHERSPADADEPNSSRAPVATFKSLFDHATNGIAVFDPELGTIVDCNQAFGDLLGYDDEEVRSLAFSALGPDDDLLRSLLEATMEDGHGWTDAITVRDTTGSDVRVALSLSAIEFTDRSCVLASVQPSSGRTEYERRLEALNDASRRLMSAETTDEIGRITVNVVETVLRRSLTAVWHSSDDEEGLRPVAASAEATSASGGSADEPISPIEVGTAEMEIYESGDPVLLEEYGTIANPAHPEMGLEARFVVPLKSHGVLAVGSTGSDALDGSVQKLVGILAKNTRAAFSRLEHEQLLRQRSGALDAAIDGMAITDTEGVFTYMNDVHAELFGYDTPDVFIGGPWHRLFGADEIERFESTVLPAVHEQGSWRGEATGTREDGTEFPIELTLAALEDGGIVCIVRDGTERRAQQRQLEALNDVARDLMNAEDCGAVGRITVIAVEDVLGFDRACVRLFDSETNRLDYATYTTGAKTLIETYAAYDLEATLAGHAFRDQRTVIEDSPTGTVTEQQWISRSSLHVPLGTHGVVSIIADSDEPIEEREIQLVEMLAVNARTAMDRAERVQLLSSQKRELRHQHDQLETHNQINVLVQEIGRQLIKATTRDELEETICEQLVSSELYHSAWIGEIEPSGDRLSTHVGFGIRECDLEAINEMSIPSIGHGSVERMLESGSIEVVRSYQLAGERGADDDDTDSPREPVLSTAAIPITYGDHLVGVLVVNGVGAGVFGEETVSGFELLGSVTGFAINAIRNRRLLLSDSVIELEFVVTDPRTFSITVSTELDGECRFERSVPIEAGKILNYHTITGSDPAAVLSIAANDDQIEDARVITDGDDQLLLQTLTSKSTAHVALQSGATLRSAVATDGEARIVLEAPQTADVREIVTLFDEQFANVELVAKRERDRSLETATEFRQTVDSSLTEKQRSALESAYASGYYEWPRAITAEELATSMEISSSTLHQHLRKGVWSLLQAFLDDPPE